MYFDILKEETNPSVEEVNIPNDNEDIELPDVQENNESKYSTSDCGTISLQSARDRSSDCGTTSRLSTRYVT